jgi:tetrahydromethanopterin S-methyltransferase subunit B
MVFLFEVDMVFLLNMGMVIPFETSMVISLIKDMVKVLDFSTAVVRSFPGRTSYQKAAATMAEAFRLIFFFLLCLSIIRKYKYFVIVI